MKSVFNSGERQREFSEKGYIALPLLTQDDLNKLLELFNRHREQYQSPFHTSHFSTDKQYKQEVHEAIAAIVFPRIKPLLKNYRAVFGNFMIKNPNSDYFMPLHADWTYVDESRFRSVAVWVPLVDTDETNGCLGIIEGSHRVTNSIRGPRIRQSSYDNDMEWVKRFGKLLPVKAGHAIVYDHGLLHYSPPNKTNVARPALNLSIVPQEADVLHYCIPEGADAIETYDVKDDSFFIFYDNYQRPETSACIKTLPASSVPWIDERMKHFGKRNLLQRAVEIFKR